MSKNFIAYYQKDFSLYTIEPKNNNNALNILPTMIHLDCPKTQLNDFIIKELMIKNLEELIYFQSKLDQHKGE